MPELPEVETTRRALEPYLAGKYIESAIFRRRDLRWPVPHGLEETLEGKRILALRRIGKYIVMDMENGISLITHLGMSGSFRIAPFPDNNLKKHDHILICMEGGATAIYHDPRRFGFMLPCPTADLAHHPLLMKMGPDPLDKTTFTSAFLHAALKQRKTAVKLAIMDQQLIAGMGNIYASEALFQAGIHPAQPACKLTKKDADRLKMAVVAVFQAALASGGSTLRDYVSGENVSGYFQHHFAVYGRENAPCPLCNHPVKKQAMGGRATYFCGQCQR